MHFAERRGCTLRNAVDVAMAPGAAAIAAAQGVMTTFAGNDWVFPGDGKPA